MIEIQKIDHIGIRVHEEARAVSFYESLGFKVEWRSTFEKGHPIIMKHPCGIAINILGPANQPASDNILQDVKPKYAGFTHMALKVKSLTETESFMNENQIKITERLKFGTLNAFFVRDPDGNVIEFDEYPGDDPDTRQGHEQTENLTNHPD